MRANACGKFVVSNVSFITMDKYGDRACHHLPAVTSILHSSLSIAIWRFISYSSSVAPLIDTSSVRKMSTALPGMAPPAPREP
jgi:hypothetical protein